MSKFSIIFDFVYYNINITTAQQISSHTNNFFLFVVLVFYEDIYYYYTMKIDKNMTQQIDYSRMTEEEFLEFLDNEAKRIREEYVVSPLTPYHIKYAQVSLENYNQNA